jgi:hypothetical protein
MSKTKISFFLILLIVTIPFYTSSVFAATQQPIVGEPGEGTLSTTEFDIVGAGQACINKHTKSSEIVELLDNSVIGTLESIAATLYMIVTVYSQVGVVLNTFATIFGTTGCCHFTPYLEGLCAGLEGTLNAFKLPFKGFVEMWGCFVTCAWCRGQKCGGIMGDLYPVESMEKYGVKLDPFENIYVATACLCPVAILFNIRKLKTIYQTYNCCIEQACINGQSLESCERHFDEEVCMYYEGGIYKSLISTVIGVFSTMITKFVVKKIGEVEMWNCVLAILEVVQIPANIQSLMENWKWVTETFEEPTCSELNFKDIRESQKRFQDRQIQQASADVIMRYRRNVAGIRAPPPSNPKVGEDKRYTR